MVDDVELGDPNPPVEGISEEDIQKFIEAANKYTEEWLEYLYDTYWEV